MSDETEQSAEDIARLFAKADASVVTEADLITKEKEVTKQEILNTYKDLSDAQKKGLQISNDQLVEFYDNKFLKFKGDLGELFEQLGDIDPEFTVYDASVNQYEERIKQEKAYRRYESKEEIPHRIELKGTIRYPDSEKFTQGEAHWMTTNTTKDYTASSTEPFLQPVSTGNWITRSARSILEKSKNGYVQYKGAGNPEKPNFPPRINSQTSDAGHEILWAVSREEAERTIQVSKVLDSLGESIPHTAIVKVIKLDEVPVPINGEGGVEIRPFVDAYTTPWEHSDHVRRREIDQMRSRLVKNRHMLPTDQLSDEDIVINFYYKEGFYQIQSEKPVAFKNDIANLIESPLLLDYLAGEETSTLESQAKKVLWIAQELGRTYGIHELENLKLPEDLDLEQYKQEILVVKDEEERDENGKKVNIKYADYRHMSSVVGNQLSERHASSMRNYFNLDPEEKLYQIEGTRLYSELLSRLTPEAQKDLTEKIQKDQEKIVLAYTNSMRFGVSLGQAISSKDTILGMASDYWLAGSYFDYLKHDDSDTLTLLSREEIATRSSWTTLERLKPSSPEISEEERFIQNLKSENIFKECIEKTLKNRPIDIKIGDSERRSMMTDRLIELHKKYLELKSKLEQLRKQQDINMQEAFNLMDEMHKYPAFIRHLKY